MRADIVMAAPCMMGIVVTALSVRGSGGERERERERKGKGKIDGWFHERQGVGNLH